MVPTQDLLYIISIVIAVGIATLVDMRLTKFFLWLEDITTVGGEIINRLDRLNSTLYDLSKSFHTDYDFLSNKLFRATIDASKHDITKELLSSFTTKNGKLKKSIANEIIKLAADEAARRKGKNVE